MSFFRHHNKDKSSKTSLRYKSSSTEEDDESAIDKDYESIMVLLSLHHQTHAKPELNGSKTKVRRPQRNSSSRQSIDSGSSVEYGSAVYKTVSHPELAAKASSADPSGYKLAGSLARRSQSMRSNMKHSTALHHRKHQVRIFVCDIYLSSILG